MLDIGRATRNTMCHKNLGIHLFTVEMMADSRSFEWNRRDGTQLDCVGGGELIDVGTRGWSKVLWVPIEGIAHPACRLLARGQVVMRPQRHRTRPKRG